MQTVAVMTLQSGTKRVVTAAWSNFEAMLKIISFSLDQVLWDFLPLEGKLSFYWWTVESHRWLWNSKGWLLLSFFDIEFEVIIPVPFFSTLNPWYDYIHYKFRKYQIAASPFKFKFNFITTFSTDSRKVCRTWILRPTDKNTIKDLTPQVAKAL